MAKSRAETVVPKAPGTGPFGVDIRLKGHREAERLSTLKGEGREAKVSQLESPLHFLETGLTSLQE